MILSIFIVLQVTTKEFNDPYSKNKSLFLVGVRVGVRFALGEAAAPGGGGCVSRAPWEPDWGADPCFSEC